MAGGSTWPDALYAKTAAAIGTGCAVLLATEERWVHRRVETVDVLSSQALRRTVSIDFTVPEPIRPLLELDGEQWLVPLATLRKQPLRHFDLRDEAGGALAQVGREQNGPIAHQALAAAATVALTARGLPAPSERLTSDLRRVATTPIASAEHALDCLVAAAVDGDPECVALFEDDNTTFLLTDLVGNYILLALVDGVDQRRVLKFAYDESLDRRLTWRDVSERLGWRPLGVLVDTPAAGRCASYHAEIVIPEELRIAGAVLLDDEGGVYGTDEDADRGAVYSSSVPPGVRAQLVFGVLPERVGFPVLAAIVATLTTLLLALGAIFGDLNAARAGPPISILLAGSAIFAAAIVRAGEHRLVQALFALPRVLLAAVAVLGLVASGFLAFGASSHALCLVWSICAGLAVACTAPLLFSAWRARSITPARLGFSG